MGRSRAISRRGTVGRSTFVCGGLLLALSIPVPALADHIPTSGNVPDHCIRVEPTSAVPQPVEIGRVTFSVDQWFIDPANRSTFNAFRVGTVSGLGEGEVVDYAIKGSSDVVQEGTLHPDLTHGFLEPLQAIEHVTFCVGEGEVPTTVPGSEEGSSAGGSTGGTQTTSGQGSTQSDETDESGSAEDSQQPEVLDETLARTGLESDDLPLAGLSSVMAGLGLVLVSRWLRLGRHSA